MVGSCLDSRAPFPRCCSFRIARCCIFRTEVSDLRTPTARPWDTWRETGQHTSPLHAAVVHLTSAPSPGITMIFASPHQDGLQCVCMKNMERNSHTGCLRRHWTGWASLAGILHKVCTDIVMVQAHTNIRRKNLNYSGLRPPETRTPQTDPTPLLGWETYH